MTAVPKAKPLLIALVLGIGLTLGLLEMLIAFRPGVGNLFFQTVRAAGPLYVAPWGTDEGNDCTESANPCATVQHAVDVAVAGDEIRVATGVYTGINVRPRNDVVATGLVTQMAYLSKTVTVRGGYNSDYSSWDPNTYPTTLDAQGRGRVFYITGHISPTIVGLHITNGDAAGLEGGLISDGDAGGGAYAISATVILSNNQVFNNTTNRWGLYDVGGGIYVGNGQVILNSNIISSNTSVAGGGVAWVLSHAVLSDNTIVSNTAEYGGGVGFGTLGDVTMVDNIVISNTADVGGGMYIGFGSTGLLDNNIIRGNMAIGDRRHDGGGGIQVDETSFITLTNTVVSNNQATHGGPGIAVRNSSGANLIHTTIAGNSGGNGSGIEVVNSTVALTNTILVSHTIGITVSAGSTATLNGILWFGNGANTGGAGTPSATNEYTGSPAFATDGYHLTANSAAIGRGVSAGVTIDIDGEARTMPPDLGVDEYLNENPQGCDAYPIALHISSLEGLTPGDLLANIRNGTGSGNFGWLRWTDDSDAINGDPNSEAYLAEELINPHLAVTDYREPEHKDSDDTSLNAGDWVWAMTGNINSNGVARAELERLISEGTEMRVPVWDVAEGTGANVVYHIVGFAQVRLDDFDLAGNPKEISVTFLGWDNGACPEVYPDLVIDKSASRTSVRPGETLTYTLTFSNTGPALATGVVISDVLPSSLTGLSITHSGAAITPTAGVTYAWEVQDLATNQRGTITITGQLGDGAPVEGILTNTAVITGSGMETDITNNSSSAVVFYQAEVVYLPLILK